LTGSFKYNCSEARLSTQENPQIALNRAIREHVDEWDDAKTLLMFYYTGHGMVKESDRRLQFYAGPGRRVKSHCEPKAYWDEAEMPLLNSRTMSDTLVFLDCCFAGNAQKGHVNKPRIYELLAAAPPEESTPAPGPRSFTNSLINCVAELLGGGAEWGFSTNKLLARLGRHRSALQTPVLYNQLHKYEQCTERHVRLAPLET